MNTKKTQEINRAIGRGDYHAADAHLKTLTSTKNPQSLFTFIRHPKDILGFSQVSAENARKIAAHPELMPGCAENLHINDAIMTVYITQNIPRAATLFKRQPSFFAEIQRQTGTVVTYHQQKKIGSGTYADVYLYTSPEGNQRAVKKSKTKYCVTLASEAQYICTIDTIYVATLNDGTLQCTIYTTRDEGRTHDIPATLLEEHDFHLHFPLTKTDLTSQIAPRIHDLIQISTLHENINPYWLYTPHIDFYSQYAHKEYLIARTAYQALGNTALLTYVRTTQSQCATRLLLPYAPGGKITQQVVLAITDEHVLAHVCLKLLDAVRALHDQGIVHGDLKMNNVRLLITKNNTRQPTNHPQQTSFISHNGQEYFIQLTLINYNIAYRRTEMASVFSAQSSLYAANIAPERKTNNTLLKAHENQDVFSLGHLVDDLTIHSPAGVRLKKTHPSIPQFIQEAIQQDPEHRPTITSFHQNLTEDIQSQTCLGLLRLHMQRMQQWGSTFFSASTTTVITSSTSSDLLHQRHPHRFHPTLL